MGVALTSAVWKYVPFYRDFFFFWKRLVLELEMIIDMSWYFCKDFILCMSHVLTFETLVNCVSCEGV